MDSRVERRENEEEDEEEDEEEIGLLDAAITWLFNEASSSRGDAGGQVLYPDESSQCDAAVEQVKEALVGAARIPLRLPLAKNMDSSLFAHYLWNASVVLANLIAQRRVPLAKDCKGLKSCIELGAGCGLPSLVLAAMRKEETLTEKSVVMITDYDDKTIFNALEESIAENLKEEWRDIVMAMPHNWGSDCKPLLNALNERHESDGTKKFGLIFMADTLWKSDCHGILLESCAGLLEATGAIYVAFCNHSGGSEPKDFFALATTMGFVYEEAIEPQWLSDPSFSSADDEYVRKVPIYRMTFAGQL